MHRWKQQFGQLEVNEARRLKELERENSELKKMPAESLLKNRVLEAVCEKNSKPGASTGTGADDRGGRGVLRAGRLPNPAVVAIDVVGIVVDRRPRPSSNCRSGCGNCRRPIPATGIGGSRRCCAKRVGAWASVRCSGGGEPTDTSTETPEQSGRDAMLLYEKLEQVTIPMFYRARDRYLDIMRHAIALNGSFFNTQCMVLQYVLKAYFR